MVINKHLSNTIFSFAVCAIFVGLKDTAPNHIFPSAGKP